MLQTNWALRVGLVIAIFAAILLGMSIYQQTKNTSAKIEMKTPPKDSSVQLHGQLPMLPADAGVLDVGTLMPDSGSGA